jgi:hypothetical protein
MSQAGRIADLAFSGVEAEPDLADVSSDVLVARFSLD